MFFCFHSIFKILMSNESIQILHYNYYYYHIRLIEMIKCIVLQHNSEIMLSMINYNYWVWYYVCVRLPPPFGKCVYVYFSFLYFGRIFFCWFFWFLHIIPFHLSLIKYTCFCARNNWVYLGVFDIFKLCSYVSSN